MEEEKITVFVCQRGLPKDTVKIQLELPRRILEAYKAKSDSKYTAKQIMENMLTNWIDGVEGK